MIRTVGSALGAIAMASGLAFFASPAAAGPAAAPAFNWTGFYLGINGGYDFGSFDVVTHSSIGKLDAIVRNFSADGALLGGTVGANTQAGNIVLGLEGDLDWARISGTADPIKPDASPASMLTADIDWLATIRARAGLVSGNTLVFATAGVAAGGVSGTITNFPSGDAVTSIGRTQYGTVFGVGIESSLTPHLSAKLEVLHVDLGTSTYDLIPTIMTADAHPAANIIRVGLNYKF
jgi:outer membrane immunogenic protein